MAHAHEHTTVPVASTGNNKAFYISIGLNVAYVIAEIIAGLLYNSMALLTDAGHNLSDVGSLILSLVAFRLARKKSTKRLTYGYKKTTILAALANACILMVAIGILAYESIHRFLEPASVEGHVIAWVAGIGIVINALSALLFYKDRKKDLNIKSAYIHLMADALVSLGVVAAGIIISFTGWFILDPLIGMIVLAVIVISTWGLLRDSFLLSVDAVPQGIDLENIKSVITAVPRVEGVHHVHIWALSTTENALTAHVRLKEGISAAEKVATVKEIKHELADAHINHSTIEIDSTSEDADR